VKQSVQNVSIKLAEELDIDNVIPNLGKDFEELDHSESESFKISNNEYELNSDHSIPGRQLQNKTEINRQINEPSGLISSDSDFEAALIDTGLDLHPEIL
jgi:hypothetical protein